MKDKIRFIHCSDIHLGANPYSLKQRFNDMGMAFKEAVDYAIKNKDDIDFFVIAGDLFDKKSLNAETLNQAVNIIKPLSDLNIAIYVTEGNHDSETYYTNYSWLDFMNEKNYIKLLNPIKDENGVYDLINYELENKGSYIETDDYIIYGLGFPGIMPVKYINNLAEKYLENKNDKYVITMLHSGIGHFVTEGMGGMKENEIDVLSDKSDYIALGHIHTNYVNVDKKYFNPGSLENSSIPDVVEDKGFFDVTISKDKKINYEFIKVNNRKLLNITVDLNNVANTVDAYDEVIKKIDGFVKTDNITKEDNAICQVKIKGQLLSQGTNIKLNELKDDIKERFGFLYVELQNKLVNKREGVDIDIKTLSREEIDKNAIKNLIIDNGFEKEDVDKLLDITLKMKNLTADGDLDLSSSDGKNIKEELLTYVRSKKINKDKKENENENYNENNNEEILKEEKINED